MYLIVPVFALLCFMQFTSWVDAVIFVFSLENEASFNAVYAYYTKLSHFRNSTDRDIPIILVGTQGKSIVLPTLHLFYFVLPIIIITIIA